jgi:hypothetical protein
MLYEVNRHEALSSSSWDAAKAHEYIERVTTDTELRFSREEYWPIHPLDEEQPPGTKVYSMYMGTAGVIWGLDYLIRAGAINGRVDFGGIVPELIAATRSRLEARAAAGVQHGYDGLLGASAGQLLVAARLEGLSTTADKIGAAVDANWDNPVREYMFGSPGTAMLSLALFNETGDEVWASRFRRDVSRLWETLEPCQGADCLIWEQDLQGQKATHMGAVHGFAGNVLPALRGRDLLPEGERKKWLECIARTLRATAIHDGELVNWPQSVGKHRLGRTALLVQHCHGAPGIVNCVADFPSSGIDDLLLAAGETIWRAGPVRKGCCICHGTAGNGYAFLKLFNRTGDEKWLERARRFAAHSIDQCEAAAQQFGQYRYSLWTGDIGLAIFLWGCINGDDRIPTQDIF